MTTLDTPLKSVGKIVFRGRQWKNTRPRNSSYKHPSTSSVESWGANWAYTQGLPQGNAASTE